MKYLMSLALILLVSNVYAAPLTMEESSKAACRVNVYKYFGKSLGSGTVIMDKGNNYYILTNGHVINEHTRVTVQFTVDGYMSTEVPAEVIWEYYVKDTSLDAGLLKINKRDMKGYVPTVIPLAPQNIVITSRIKIQGSGYPAGRWNQSWIARVLKLKENIISFTMPPEGGQSGSGITAVYNDVTYWVGMATWRIDGKMHFNNNNGVDYGAGLTVHRLYDMINRRALPDKIETSYHISEHNIKYNSGFPHTDCHRCKLGKKHHLDVKGKLHCPICKKHNKSFDLHTQDELLTSQCFPLIPRIFGGDPWGPGIRIPGPDPRKPRPNPRQPKTNPNNGPEGIWPDSPSTPKVPDVPKSDPHDIEEIGNLNKKIKNLESKLGQLNENNVGLAGQVKLWKKQLDDLTKKKNNLEGKYNTLDSDHRSVLNDLTKSQVTITSLEGKSNHWLDPTVKSYGVSGNGVENTSVVIGSLLLGSLVGPFLTRKLGVVGGKIAFWFVKRAAKKAGSVIHNKVEDYFEKKVENNPLEGYNIIAPQASVPSTQPVVNEYAKQQIQLSKHNGQDPEEWAVKGQLYKEAVDYLRQGRLSYKAGIKLLGQVQAASAMDNWVINGYMAKLTSAEFQSLQDDEVLRDATLGRLYHEAVQKLRRKEFGQILNPQDIANAVDTWVNKELMRLLTTGQKTTNEKEG